MRRLWAVQSFKPVERKRYEFVQRWFTPSDSDGSGMVAPTTPAPGLPPAPTETDSKAKAAEEIARMKRMRAMSGGKTILTSEGMGTGTTGKTLLGA